MLYQLPNGKCVEITTEQFLRLTDQDLVDMMAFNSGDQVNDPFALSVLRHGPSRVEDDDTDDDEITELEDLTDISSEEKLYDDDYIDRDNITE